MTTKPVPFRAAMVHRLRPGVCLCGAVALFAACQPTTQSAPPVSGGFLTQAQLLATFPGNTASGISNSDNATPWTQTYSAAAGATRGTIRGSFGGAPYDATWAVSGEQWCEDWVTDSVCYTFQQAGPQTLRPFEDGTALPNLWSVD